MSNTLKRILGAVLMVCVAAGAVVLECYGIPGVRILSVGVAIGMVIEFIGAAIRASVLKKNNLKKPSDAPRLSFYIIPVLWLILLVGAAWNVGRDPWIMLLLLLIISAADIGAWFFGRMIGGDKMWSRLSPKKTWSGQIAGIICGTIISVAYGFWGTAMAAGSIDGAVFMPDLIWIGVSVAILSQYGDLTESWFKRKMGIKDMSNLLVGHGGLCDRFDGWIYALPLMWVIMAFGAN